MTMHVALLRGINVGGHKLVAMSDLRDLLDAPRLRGDRDRERMVDHNSASWNQLASWLRKIDELRELPDRWLLGRAAVCTGSSAGQPRRGSCPV